MASDIYEAIGYALLNESAITDVVGSRIYHGIRPEGDAPCINYFEVGYIPLHNGVVESPRYQISCRAADPKVAQELARTVCTVFHNYRGSVDGFAIDMGTIEDKRMLPEPNTNLYHVPVDVRFVYSELTVS